MKKSKHVMMYVVTFLFAVALIGAHQVALAQQTPAGRLSGTVVDPDGAVVPGADVVAKDVTTNVEYRAKSNADGYFLLPGLPVGTYAVTATAANFKSTVVRSVVLSAATPVDLRITLQPGEIIEQVTVEAGAEVLINKTSETISNTITGRQIVELPFTSRDALDLALTQPGVATPGRPRTTSINGLPKGAINLSMDGINIQDNLLRSSDGFFAYIRPRIDAVEEVTVTTSNPGAAAAGEGAVAINFVTKAGTNEWHGGAWWYHRNTALNSNFFFNNQTGVPRQRIILNQFGWKVGGPILKNKFFFFYSHDNYRLPTSVLRSRTILTTEAAQGVFTYRRRDNGQIQQVNLLTLAAANGFPNQRDSAIGGFLDQINQARSLGSVSSVDLFRQRLSFNNAASGRRDFPTARLDYNITEKLHWEGIAHYQYFSSFPDTLNGFDPRFPGFSQAGGQISNRFQLTTALRATISSTMVNEFRFGLTGGSVGFAAEVGPETFPGGFRMLWPLVDTPTLNITPSRRNTPVKQWFDNFTWIKGKHNFAFGTSVSLYTSWIEDFDPFGYGSAIPDVSFGILASDPANAAMFSVANFPGIDPTTDLISARALYALLVGRLTSVSGAVYVNEKTRQFEQGGPLTERNRHIQYGFYGQDSWRVRPTFTLNYGLRWEYQGPPKNTNNIYGDQGLAGLFGVSGEGNLFQPCWQGIVPPEQRICPGSPTVYNQATGSFDADLNNFAPNLGFAWTPSVQNGVLRKIFGSEGQTVLRGGYGITYTREGLLLFNSFMLGPNPGPTAIAQLVADVDFPAGSLQFNGGQGLPPLVTFPQSYGFPLRQADFQSRGLGPNGYPPEVRVPYVQEWTLSLQREIARDTVLEFRYVGNHAVKLMRQVDLNEANIFENGFLQEFLAARNNLAIARAMFGTSARGQNFRNQNLPGQVPLPIMAAAFGRATAPQFGDALFISFLDSGQAGSFAGQLAFGAAFSRNFANAGFAPNLFVVNPEAVGFGDYLLYNGGDSTYHAFQIDLRRRLSQGLLIQANYSFSKSLTDMGQVSGVVFNNYRTLRNTSLSKGLSPFDITQALKVNYIYELPFGPGHRWSSDSGWLNKLIGGWAQHGIIRLQSGSPFLLTSGRQTVNQSQTNFAAVGSPLDSGVILKGGLTRKKLQEMLKPSKLGDGRIFFFPLSLVGTDGRANPEFIDVPTTPGEFGQVVYLHGPKFYRFDLSLIKKTTITETTNIEFRAEFLNAFNHTNFYFARTAATNSVPVHSIVDTTFGQIVPNQAYQDTSTTDDPGGRLIQFVIRFNF